MKLSIEYITQNGQLVGDGIADETGCDGTGIIARVAPLQVRQADVPVRFAVVVVVAGQLFSIVH